MLSATKDPTKVRAGTMGAQKKWANHTPRVVRLDSLLEEERAVVLALLALKRRRERSTVPQLPDPAA